MAGSPPPRGDAWKKAEGELLDGLRQFQQQELNRAAAKDGGSVLSVRRAGRAHTR